MRHALTYKDHVRSIQLKTNCPKKMLPNQILVTCITGILAFYSPHESPYKVEKITSKGICCLYPSAKNPQVTEENRRSNFSNIVWSENGFGQQYWGIFPVGTWAIWKRQTSDNGGITVDLGTKLQIQWSQFETFDDLISRISPNMDTSTLYGIILTIVWIWNQLNCVCVCTNPNTENIALKICVNTLPKWFYLFR